MPLSDPHHTDRIERDIRMLAVSIASTVDTAEQWRTFCNDGGGILPLLKCIREAAKEIEEGSIVDPDDENYETMLAMTEETLATACSACKTLRDLCAISKSHPIKIKGLQLLHPKALEYFCAVTSFHPVKLCR